MVARVLEEMGLVTTSISMVKEHSESIKPPRALFVPFPFGQAFGEPNDPEGQHRVLRAALDLLSEPSGPVLRDYPDSEADDDEPFAPIQASGVVHTGGDGDVAMEATRMRRYHEQFVERYGRTSVGLTHIPPTRFRGIVRFLEAYAETGVGDMPERPADMPLHAWIRLCVDDLKAMYYEACVAMNPDITGGDAAIWFWGETALGRLIRSIKAQLESSDDPATKASGYGIAR